MCRCCLDQKCIFANFRQFLSVAFHKVQNVKGEGTKIIYTVLAVVSNLFVAQKLLLFLVWHSRKKNKPLSLLHLQGPIFDSITRLNSITEICHFSTCLQAGAPEMTRQQSILNTAYCVVKCVMWNGWVRYFFLLGLICVLKIVQHSKLL